MKHLGAVLLAGVLALGWSQTSSAAVLVLDNFNKGEKPNALGGDYGAWNRDENDPTQWCVNSFDKTNAYGGAGYALKLDYDVDSPNPAYNGFWSKLQNLDGRAYKQLSLYVKGDNSRGYTSQIKVELKNDKETGRYLLTGVTDEWKKFTIPLKEFNNLTDLTKLTEFVIVFDDITSNKKVGSIYIDELTFE